MRDHLYNVEQRIISWKPLAPPTFEINTEAHQGDDRTFAVEEAVVHDAEFKWSLGVTREIISPLYIRNTAYQPMRSITPIVVVSLRHRRAGS